jgi:hypothetical protein
VINLSLNKTKQLNFSLTQTFVEEATEKIKAGVFVIACVFLIVGQFNFVFESWLRGAFAADT